MIFTLPNFHNMLPLGRLQCLCIEDWGYGRVTAEPPQSSASPELLALALSCSNDQALWAAVLPQKPRVFMWFFFCSKWQYFSPLNYSLSLWTCKLLRRRKLSCLLLPLSLSHDFLLKTQALLQQSVRFNILFKLNVLRWPNQMVAGWPQEWELRYCVI